ncbi:MAG: helix-turn-helix transcriptional regulator, partial [Limisphaerales bacterium]
MATQANWSVADLAKLCGASVRKLQRDFHKNMGQCPKIWLLEQRQREAGKLLRKNNKSIKEVAAHLGYKHAHHFSREFKKYWGICPKEFIE